MAPPPLDEVGAFRRSLRHQDVGFELLINGIALRAADAQPPLLSPWSHFEVSFSIVCRGPRSTQPTANWSDPRPRDLEELPRQNRGSRRDPAPLAIVSPIRFQSDGITLRTADVQPSSSVFGCIAWLCRHHHLLPLRVPLPSSWRSP